MPPLAVIGREDTSPTEWFGTNTEFELESFNRRWDVPHDRDHAPYAHAVVHPSAIEFIGRYMPDASRPTLRGQGTYVWRDGLLRPHDIEAVAAFLLGFADLLPRWVFADHTWAGIDGKNAAALTTANDPKLGGTSWSR